jgi:hypothetical protein
MTAAAYALTPEERRYVDARIALSQAQSVMDAADRELPGYDTSAGGRVRQRLTTISMGCMVGHHRRGVDPATLVDEIAANVPPAKAAQ